MVVIYFIPNSMQHQGLYHDKHKVFDEIVLVEKDKKMYPNVVMVGHSIVVIHQGSD